MSKNIVRLADVVDINPRTFVDAALESVAFLAMADVTEGGKIARIQSRDLLEVSKGYTVFQNDDVLLAKITPCFENGKAVHVSGLFSGVGYGSTEFHVLRPSSKVDGRFLFHLIWNPLFRRQGAKRMTGSAGQKRVPIAFLADFEFELPSVLEQKRAAAILDKADSLRCKRQEAICLVDDFLRAVFIDMFGDSKANSKDFPNVSLGEVVKLKSGDFLPSHEMVNSGDVLVYGGNGINGRHDKAMFGETKLVIGRVGAYCGVVHLTRPRSWITDNALYVSELSPTLRLEYLAFALKLANLNQYSSQSGQPLVSASRLYPVEIPLPPLDLQDEFLKIYVRKELSRRLMNDSLREIEELGNSLSSNLLS
jgi:type I restriction enzyme S subunit